jgi:hypothetical protein
MAFWIQDISSANIECSSFIKINGPQYVEEKIPAVYLVIEQFLTLNSHFLEHFVPGQTRPLRSIKQNKGCDINNSCYLTYSVSFISFYAVIQCVIAFHIKISNNGVI